MAGFYTSLILFGEAAAPAGGAAGGAAGNGGGGGSFMDMLPFFAIIMVLFYFMMIRPQKKKESDFKSLIDSLKKNDRVVTVGGIHGVVTNVQREAEKITLRVDESTGSTIKVGTGAIARVVTDEKKEKAS